MITKLLLLGLFLSPYIAISDEVLTPIDEDEITFYQDVAPIIQKQCQVCHQESGLAAFLPFTTYEQVKPLAYLIQNATASRRMPPFMVDNSGSCQTYEKARWLSEDELTTIARWTSQGAPAGEFVDYPPPPLASELPGQTHETAMPEPYQPNPELHDDYRCFVLDTGMSRDQALYLTDYLVVPGNDQLVHHVVAFQATSKEAAAEAMQKDLDEVGPGYSCFGGAGVQGVRMVMNWAPGTASVSHPKGTGIRLEPDLPLIFQVHYHVMSGNTGYDQTSIKMKMVEEVANEITPTFLAPLKPLIIPPKAERWVHEGQVSLQHVYGQNQPLKIMGVRAHMHKMGSEMHLSVKTKQADECLADIPKYDFNWQTSYFLENPVKISSSDPILIRCVYNSMSKNTSTFWGEGTDDEMCLATIYTIKD